MMKIVMFTAITLSAFATAVLADDRPAWDQQSGSPMDFIIHSQPEKFPHHLGRRTQDVSGYSSQLAPLNARGPSASEKALMDRVTRDTGGK